jgi:hypothetical protein
MTMNDSGEMLVQMWLAVKTYIDKKERPDAALAFLRAAEDFLDIEAARQEAKGSDSALDGAFAEILGDEEFEEEDEDEDY